VWARTFHLLFLKSWRMLHIHDLDANQLAHTHPMQQRAFSPANLFKPLLAKSVVAKERNGRVAHRARPADCSSLEGNPKAPHQQRRQTPHERQQPPQAAHETQPQPQPKPTPQRQPRHPQPPQRPQRPHPQAAICRYGPALVSLSKRLNVARLTSAISSSPSVTDWLGTKPSFCGASVVGTADAEAAPAKPKVKPAAPSAGTATFVTRFRFEDCLTRGIVASIFRNYAQPL
jgi:outer membrane biosynthesis protein TonB